MFKWQWQVALPLLSFVWSCGLGWVLVVGVGGLGGWGGGGLGGGWGGGCTGYSLYGQSAHRLLGCPPATTAVPHAGWRQHRERGGHRSHRNQQRPPQVSKPAAAAASAGVPAPTALPAVGWQHAPVACYLLQLQIALICTNSIDMHET